MIDGRLLLGWVGATWAGWLLGVPLIVALALVGELLGIGGVQVLVGAGMGIGLGLMQGRVIGRLFQKAAPWFWSSVVGLALPFLVTDISNLAGWNLPYSLPVVVIVGGLITGGWQALILRSRVPGAGLWVVATALGWMLAAVAAAQADALQHSRALLGIWGALAYLGIVALGGVALGLATGLCLAWMRGRESKRATGY